MDWVFAPSSSWVLTEPETDDINLLEKYQTMDDFSNYGTSDLIINGLSEQKHSTMSSSSTDSSKKPSAESSDQHVTCLVDGCMADLSGCRDYHRRHRVCVTHSKTPVVTICGKQQRFCQQCSRFHSLREFDEVKRSCRKRLDGHNRRRRKSRPESMCFNYGSFFTNHQGAKLLHFSGSTTYTTTIKFGSCQDREKLNQKFQFTVEQRTPSKSYSHFCSVRKRRFRFPFLLGVDSEKVNLPSFHQVVNKNGSSDHLLDEPQGVLYLLSSSRSNHSIHQASVSGPTNSLVQFNGSLNKPTGPHLQLQNVTGSSSGHTNNQLIGMIQFRADRLLEKAAAHRFLGINHHLKS